LFPTLAPFAGEPFPGFADQVVCLGVTDVLGPVCADCSNKRLGIEIVETWFTFSVPAVQDFVFVAFRIYNRSEFINAANAPVQQPGPYAIEDMSVSIAIDPDVGDSADDQISFLPAVQTMIYWDSNFAESAFIGTPGVGGVTYLLTPTDPDTGEEVGLSQFSVFVRGTVRPDPNSPEEWYKVLTGDPTATLFEVQPTDIRGQASSGLFDLPAGGVVEIYGAFFFAPAAGVPPSLLLAERPCNVTELGQQCTDPALAIPDANDHPVLDNIKAVQPTAQAVFDAGFVVPTAPPKPDIDLLPGDGEVTIVWDEPAVASINPFAKVARDPFVRLGDGSPDPAAPGQGVFLAATDVIYDPSRDVGGLSGFVEAQVAGLTGAEVTSTSFNLDFVVQDFSGFRVYRTTTGSTDDAVLIAQFDAVDGWTDGDFCTAVEEVFSGGEFVKAVCTEIETFNFGNDQGITFAVTDRGGSFPDPASGPGLINGIPVFYSVTAFSVNPGQLLAGDISAQAAATVVPSPAPLNLESGLSPLGEATPRSNASSFVNATLSDALIFGDTDVGRDQGEGEGTDEFGINIPGAANYGVARMLITNPTEVPGGEVIIHVDSLGPAFTIDGSVYDHGNLPAFPLINGDSRGRRLFYRITDSDGNLFNTLDGALTEGELNTDFFVFDGTASVFSPGFAVVDPSAPTEVIFTVSFRFDFGERDDSCVFGGCAVYTPDASGPPAALDNAVFHRGMYGQLTYGDLLVTWSNSGGVLGWSSVRNTTVDVDVKFDDGIGQERWGFAKPSGLGANEEALAAATGGIARTADGKVLYPSPLPEAVGGFNATLGGPVLPQCEPFWTDLPVDPTACDASNVTDPTGTFFGTFTSRLFADGVLSPTAALVTCPAAGGNFACGGATAGGKQSTRVMYGGVWIDFAFNTLPADGEQWLLRMANANVSPPSFPPEGATIKFAVGQGSNNPSDADLSEINVVPNPFIAANEITRGVGLQQILFTNLPPAATIRIYTISGNLLRVIEHSDGSGTEPWDVRTRFDLLAASGNYYFHVTTPDGRTKLGRFAVIN
jgi:hypothetical protein